MHLDYLSPAELTGARWAGVMGVATFEGDLAGQAAARIPSVRVSTPVLGGTGMLCEVWRTTQAVETGVLGRIRYARSADLYLDPGGEDALIGAVAAALPSEYRRQRGAATGHGAAPLTAQVGGSVTLTVAQLGDGWVRATAQSDCRTAGSTSAPAPAGTAAAAIAVLLNSLGTAPDSMHANVLPCTGGGHTVTWAAVSGTVDSGQIQNRLAPAVPPTARRFASPANRLPWRDGHTSVIVAASDDGTHVTVQYTVDCG